MSYSEVSYSSADGLSLYARDYGGADRVLTAVLCLPGLTRNAKDFETIAPRLAEKRRVICPDFRGRGKSQYAPDPQTYRPDVEMADTLFLLDKLGVPRAAVIGTSRGGIVAMLMAAKAKERVAGIAFNDVGPRLEKEGLLRIRSYLGADPKFNSWDEAVRALRHTNAGFELAAADWLAFAKRVFRDENGKPRADYDPMLTATFASIADIEAGKIPELWELYRASTSLPSLVLRGANSDLLSEETVSEMQRLHPGLQAVTVANRGHVPFLDEAESVEAIDQWLAAVDK